MKQRDIQVLQEMGLTYWQIRKPACFPALEVPVINLPDDCQLLFVTPDPLNEHDAWLFGRILKSMKLTSEQALMLPPSAVDQLGQHQLVWCWFAGCEVAAPAGVQVLNSDALATMHTNPTAKKALWQQICSYDN
ncbi:DNA polymerase III subunit psi [Photobacterium jeanii]|uniref:DNA polymerase III subunit psi n=1 Tax=Photobacterium jeanii TaxID=858640 RepID=A0A178KA23_9GAMM|nr:DNA polymerase III subunit psi [Photobacterium jeanii]OAN14199.1 DNA polymerase III subunit psi [Photobacterium jeanii]PST89718.1 DNA polymerase III subunit psi [Photobacterium jeanii]